MKSMKQLFAVALVTVATSGSAFADGFKCETLDGDLRASVFNNTDPEVGTRVAAVMVLSDPSVSHGRKTIARFKDVSGTLSNSASRYVADVDLRFNDSGRSGELIAGTKLGQIDQIILNVDYSYAYPVADGATVDGRLTLLKRDGKRIHKDMSCERYLKN